MDRAEEMHLQIRLVLVVYRHEKQRRDDLDALRARSLEILDAVLIELDGKAAWQPELLRDLADARSEVIGIP